MTYFRKADYNFIESTSISGFPIVFGVLIIDKYFQYSFIDFVIDFFRIGIFSRYRKYEIFYRPRIRKCWQGFNIILK